ncbi:uncharacterized protein PpBr36_06281 [Pyricularia pennisetigena]|uniref:uncharacterized protein n=1 Tax=Pyricularia pennisetigena TaxID=1578925 RepID=UPI0011511356|nr:uncharacterized protein PpBr36_06281 [Pyricularia pennisetigena]TLS23208.1 hypothetical protein PpBr36_06281 [Pyricularia pennisetigena]
MRRSSTTEQPVPPPTQPLPDANAAVLEPPEIGNHSLAIFALIGDDLTQPMDDRPRDRVERVKRMLDSLDKHQQAVRATTKNIVARERQRIVSHEVNLQTSGRDPGISQEEADEMIKALSAEPEQGTDYNMDTNDVPREAMRDLFEGSGSRRDREDSLRRLQHLAEQSIYYSDEFDADIGKAREKWKSSSSHTSIIGAAIDLEHKIEEDSTKLQSHRSSPQAHRPANGTQPISKSSGWKNPSIVRQLEQSKDQTTSTIPEERLNSNHDVLRPPTTTASSSLSTSSNPTTVETIRCCDRLWLVRLGGQAGTPPKPREPFPPRPSVRPRSSSQLVSSSFNCDDSCLVYYANILTDGKKVSIEAGSALIQACEKAGATVPRYCYHEKLMIAGNCRMCLVEVEKVPKPVASCAWPVQPGMVVKTNSPIAHKAREGVMEFLLANHPLDCPVCDQGGECDLQDQSMRYGADRGRFHEIGGKRAVEDKNIGPLIKTSMNRCIHCTRCVRFANDIAGANEMGSTGRGNDLQIGTYLEKNLDSELSGNVIDLCPVGALTSKPYAFRARPWELKKTESIDVMDALGANIRVDSRGLEVMRILPRLNDDVNEEWIDDKTRFACDGLRTQRLTLPLVRKEGKFEPSTWEQALNEVAENFARIAPKGNEFKVIAGQLTEVESLVAMKDMANKLGSENLALDMPSGSQPIAHGVDVRSNYLFNSRIAGVEEADAILIVGSNPRHEAAVLNARIRKQWLRSDLEIAVVGETWDSTFEFEHLGTDAAALKKALAGPFGKKLQSAKRPMIILGSGVTDHPDAKAFYEMVGAFVDKNAANFLTPEWNGYNVLQRSASRAGAFEVGFVTPSAAVAETKPKIVWLLGADDFQAADIPKDAFVIYQGHHGDRGAEIADVVLPGAAYTEKSATYINTEGRVQMTRAATSLPGAARTDWKIIRAASEFLGVPLPYDDLAMVRDRMVEISPALAAYDVVEPVALQQLSKVQLVDQNKGSKPTNAALKHAVENFYFTDVISRSSPTMARCSAAKETGNPKTDFMAPGMTEDKPMGQVAYGS